MRNPRADINPVIHCIFSYPVNNLWLAENLEYTIKQEGNVAAVIFEPVTGTNGVVVPPPGFVKRIREITEEEDIIKGFIPELNEEKLPECICLIKKRIR